MVLAAAADGVELLALTDHDTIEGVGEAVDAAAEIGIKLVPAVEISALGQGGSDLHVLGYGGDVRDATLAELLSSSRDARFRRAEAMADALRALGFELDETQLNERRAQGKPIGRPHLARAVLAHPGNSARLEEQGLTDPSAFLEALLVPGAPAFRPRGLPSVQRALDAIHLSGGVAVWAHPFWEPMTPSQVLQDIDRFREQGLDGVECFYPVHSREQTDVLAARCDQLGLLSTGSSDFHGPGHRGFSRFRAFSTFGHEPNLGPIAA